LERQIVADSFAEGNDELRSILMMDQALKQGKKNKNQSRKQKGN
jgi:hypothetical protein